MKFQDLKRQSNTKILLRGKSGRGKTNAASKIALRVSRNGGKVLYLDTEAEGSTTMVSLVENGEFEESDVENLTYKRIESYDNLMEQISEDNQEKHDLIVVDTLDSKHTFALEKVTNSKMASNADWNQYPAIYSREKQVMETLGKPKCNILCTLDPDSGKMDKPKGAQTNIHGFFTVVMDMTKNGDSWGNVTRNFVGRGDWIGKKVPDVDEVLADEVLQRVN